MSSSKPGSRSKYTPEEREKMRAKVGKGIYIGLRRYDPATQKTVNIPGKTIRAFDFTADEVYEAILDGLRRAAERAKTGDRLTD